MPTSADHPILGPCSRVTPPGFHVLAALHVDPSRRSTNRAQGRVFVAEDGEAYWLKHVNVGGNVDNKLAAELIAGRLGALLGAAPKPAIVSVSEAAVGANGEGREFVGLAFGCRDLPETENSKTFGGMFRGGAVLPPEAFDHVQRARVVAFQSWIGQRDQQLLIRVTDGRVWSVDHEEWDAFSGDVAPRLVVTPANGLPPEVGRDATAIGTAAGEIEALTDSQIFEAVSYLPCEAGWADAERLCDVADRLVARKRTVREVMLSWL